MTAATRLGWQPFFPPLAVTFAADGRPPAIGEPIPEPAGRPNLHGMARTTCRLCGECDIGCNYGAKNTLDFNYLSEAAHAGAEIRDRCEVREFEHRDGGGYVVRYVEHDLAWEGRPHDTGRLPLQEVSADARRPRGRHARHDVPAAAQPAAPGWSAGRPWARASRATATC